MPARTDGERPGNTGGSTRRTLVIILAATVGAGVFGVTAWLIGLRDDDLATVGPAVTAFSVLWSALVGGALAATLTWVILRGRHMTQAQRVAARDSIERSQSERARAGAFTDLVFVLAGGLILISLLRIDTSASLALSLLFAVGMLDFAARYMVLEHRGS